MREIERALNGEETEDKTPRITILVLGVILVCAAVVFCINLFADLKDADFGDLMPPAVSEVKEVIEQAEKIPAINKNEADAQAKIADKQGYGYSNLNISGYGQITKINDTEITVELYDTDSDKDKMTVKLIGISPKDNIQQALESQYKGKSVLIEYEPNQSEKAYVYTTDGDMVQVWLIENGYAEYDGKNLLHKDVLEKAGTK